MGLPRSRYVPEGEEGVYHCFSQCVRQAFLCGIDKLTQRDFSHRKTWLVERLRHLAAIFAIEVCAYAVMETHYHTVLRTRPDMVALWSDREVAMRWLRLFPRRRKSTHCLVETTEQDIQTLTDLPDRIVQLRKRLCSLSWFMGRLNEFIARAANKEDDVRGRFWGSRFKCQALLDETAIACCMAYVDLNPIRAGLAATPEGSDFTSIQERIRAWQQENLVAGVVAGGAATPSISTASETELETDSKNRTEVSALTPGFGTGSTVDPGGWLCPIQSGKSRRGILEMTTAEYFDLVDRSGRMTRSDKRGAIDPDLRPILTRIGAKPEEWLATVSCFQSRFRLAAGLPSSLRNLANRLGRHWLQGTAAARAAFSSPRECLSDPINVRGVP